MRRKIRILRCFETIKTISPILAQKIFHKNDESILILILKNDKMGKINGDIS